MSPAPLLASKNKGTSCPAAESEGQQQLLRKHGLGVSLNPGFAAAPPLDKVGGCGVHAVPGEASSLFR